MSHEGRKESLERQHEKLEHEIEETIKRPYYSDLEVAKLKKKKLHIKDQLVAIG